MNRLLPVVCAVSLLATALGCPEPKSGCEETGTCADAGNTPADAGNGGGGADAGTDAGADAGEEEDAGMEPMDASVPYDGGTPCAESSNPRLACSVLATLGTGAQSFSEGWIGARTGDFVVAYRTASGIQVKTVSLAGGVEAQGSVDDTTGIPFALSTGGNHWALATAPSDTKIDCYFDALDADVTAVNVPSTASLKSVSIAVNAAGGVGIAGNDSSDSDLFYSGDSATGCPTQVSALASTGYSTEGATVVAAKSGGADVFRYVRTGLVNAYNGGVDVFSVEADGGVTEVSRPRSLVGPDVHASAASSDGKTVLIAFDEADSNDDYFLTYFATSTNLAGDGVDPVTLFDDPGYWSVQPCGAGCSAVIQVKYLTDGPATVAFLSDDPDATLRGKWDAVCGLPAYSAASTSVGIARVADTLGVLVTTDNSAKLYACRMPPLP